MATIFSKIVAGEIPSYKVAENERFYAFLDINPVQKGHTLVIPKREVDYIFDLEDEELAAMHLFAKQVAGAIRRAFQCKKVGVAIGNEAMKAIASAEAESGKSIAHYDLRFLKPLDEEMLDEIGQNFKFVVTIEDGVLKGGMGSAILEYMSDHGYTPTVRRIGIPDSFVQHGTPKELYQICGMDAESIKKILLSF